MKNLIKTIALVVTLVTTLTFTNTSFAQSRVGYLGVNYSIVLNDLKNDTMFTDIKACKGSDNTLQTITCREKESKTLLIYKFDKHNFCTEYVYMSSNDKEMTEMKDFINYSCKKEAKDTWVTDVSKMKIKYTYRNVYFGSAIIAQIEK